MDSDFTQLYSQLALRPDCTLDEFKRAYRRRVAELHPDRSPGSSAASPEGGMSLSELTSLYTTATRFHRTHGRLPGAAVSPRSSRTPPSPSPPSVPLRPANANGAGGPERGRRLHTRLAILAVLLVIALIVILEASAPPAPPTGVPGRHDAVPDAPPTPADDANGVRR